MSVRVHLQLKRAPRVRETLVDDGGARGGLSLSSIIRLSMSCSVFTFELKVKSKLSTNRALDFDSSNELKNKHRPLFKIK